MSARTVNLTCPACGASKEMPEDKIPLTAVKATCRTCGHSFPIAAGRSARPAGNQPEADSQFEAATPPLPGKAKSRELSRPDAQPPQSSFVTSVAWVFIVICGFATFVSVMQNVMVNTLMPLDQMEKATTDPAAQQMPAFFRFMMGNVRLFFASFLVVSASMFVSAVGLLKRKDWARLLFIAILSLGILWNVGGLALQFTVMRDFPKQVGAPPDFAASFSTMKTVIMVFSALTAVGFSALFGWIIKRLISREVVKEFTNG